jgi:hypothetical protein
VSKETSQGCISYKCNENGSQLTEVVVGRSSLT